MAIELATAYVSLVPETSKLEKGLKDSFANVGKYADTAGKEAGTRLAKTASKALKDGWRPDQDIMAGIPNTKLDRVGARIGQVIGKGVAGGLKAQQLGKDFGHGFADGAKSVGLGRVVSGWKAELSSGGLAAIGKTAGKSLMMGVTGAAAIGAAGIAGAIGTALSKGFDRLLTIDKSKQKLKALGKSTGEVADIVKIVTDSVTGTPFSLDQAFATAVQAIGAGTADIGRFMKNVADAAGFAGTDIDRMGLIFNQVLAKGKLTGEEMMQLMEAGMPAKSWIQKSYNLTAEQFDDMQRKGEITLDMLQKSIEDHAPGMAKTLGDSLQGSIDKMQTALARLGADFLVAIFGGDSSKATDTMADSVQKITDKLNTMDEWVKANGPEIQKTFQTIGTIVSGVFTEMSETISQFMSDIKLLASGLANLVGYAAGFDEFMARFGLGDQDKGTSLRNLERSLREFGNPNPAGQQGGGPNASRERRGLAPVIGSNEGLKQNAVTLKESIASLFPQVREIGGYRPNDPFPDHPSGRAIDVMIPPELVGTPEGKALGDRINQFALQSGLAQYTMWEQKQFNAGGGVTGMPDRSHMGAGVTQNHFDHVHIYTNMGDVNSALSAVGQGVKPGTSGPVTGGAPTGSDLLKRLSGLGGTFDTGGWLPNGTQIVNNNTGKPELILNPDQQKALADQGIDPQSLLHGTGGGAAPGPNPGAPSADVQAATPGGDGLDFVRSMGFIPASAGSTGVAGTSSLSGFINMGNSVVSGIIDTGTNLAQQAVSAAIMAGAAGGGMGAGAAAAPLADMAASYGIQLAGNQAKRISQYGFQMLGIGADALMEQISPFGIPRALGYDYTNFAPNLNIQQALTSTVEKMGQDAIGRAFPQPVDTTSGPAAPTTPVPSPQAVPAQQFDAIAANSAQPQQNAPLVENLYATDIDGAFRALDQTQRRNMMQYAGRP